MTVSGRRIIRRWPLLFMSINLRLLLERPFLNLEKVGLAAPVIWKMLPVYKLRRKRDHYALL